MRFQTLKPDGSIDAFDECWLAPPLQVETVSAAALLPTVCKGMLEPSRFDDPGNLIDMLRTVDSVTFMPCCDRASANLSIMRWWAHSVHESLPADLRQKFLYWPDTCGAYLVARGKLVLCARPHAQ